jgi:hypothetical protein
VTPPRPSFEHLLRLSDAGGLYEHAELTTPRVEHGYCVDDVARGLVVLWREPDRTAELEDLAASYLDFVLGAQSADGRFRNRRAADLTWSDTPTVEDCWGRALWGLGAVVAGQAPAADRERALRAFERGAAWQSPWTRAMAFAGLGAASVVDVLPDHRAARELLSAAARSLGRPADSVDWPWPESRLTYGNAAVPDVLLAAGAATGDGSLVADGLLLLEWLLDRQVREGRLSLVPVGGAGPGELGPQFDQQPIEAAALADACARAFSLTGARRWEDAVLLCSAWFAGSNDSRTSLHGSRGGGCDGLESDGRNDNQGAESTLALLSTLQQAQLVTGRSR